MTLLSLVVFVALQQSPEAPTVAGASPSSARWTLLSANDADMTLTQACEPACRSGFTCLRGTCTSACNPPCGAGEQCSAQGECLLNPRSGGSREEVMQEIRRERAFMPGIGGAVALIVSGSPFAIVALIDLGFILFSGYGGTFPLISGIVLGCSLLVGAPLIIIGAVLLASRLPARARSQQRIQELEEKERSLRGALGLGPAAPPQIVVARF